MPANESPVATGMNNLRVESADAAREWLSLEHLALGVGTGWLDGGGVCANAQGT